MSGGRPGRGATLAAVLAAALFPTFATWLYFVILPGTRWMTPVYLACKAAQFAFPLVWVLGVERAHPTLWKRPSRVGLFAGLVSGVVLSASIYFLWNALFAGGALAERAETAVSEKLAGFGISTPGGYLLLTAFYCVLHSLLEEYYWRWFVFGRLRRFVRVAPAAVLSSLAFMSHHVLVAGELAGSYGPLTWIVSLTVAFGGLVWAWLYDGSRTLYGVWLSHALVDAALLWIGYGLWRG
jgi:hypothetical protein